MKYFLRCLSLIDLRNNCKIINAECNAMSFRRFLDVNFNDSLDSFITIKDMMLSRPSASQFQALLKTLAKDMLALIVAFRNCT